MSAIDDLRALASLNETDQVYTVAKLNVYLIESGQNVDLAAARIWSEKAANAAGLVNMQEGTSRRELSKLYEQAIAMSNFFRTRATTGDGGVVEPGRYSKVRSIERN